MAIVIGKRRILAIFGFNSTALRATQPKQHSMFISRRTDVVYQPRSCDLTSLDYYLWGAIKNKCYADKPETIDGEKLVKYSCTQSIMLLKNWTNRVGYYLASRGSHLNEWNFFPLLTGRIVLSNKKRNLRKYSVVFCLKHFPRKRYLMDPLCVEEYYMCT